MQGRPFYELFKKIIHYTINGACLVAGVLIRGYTLYYIVTVLTSTIPTVAYSCSTPIWMGGSYNVRTRSPLNPPMYNPYPPNTFEAFETRRFYADMSRKALSYTFYSRYRELARAGRETDSPIFEGLIADSYRRFSDERRFEFLKSVEKEFPGHGLAATKRKLESSEAEKLFASVEGGVIPVIE